MGPTTRPNGFPTLHKPISNNMDNTQRLASITGRAWPQNSTWSTYGLPSTSHRDTANSRGSDDLSPTAASGSAQSNPRVEHLPWGGRGAGGWPTTTGPEDVSPTHTQDNVLYNGQESRIDTHIRFMSQGPSTLHGHGTALPTLHTLLEPLSSEERASSDMYSATSTSNYHQQAVAFLRRNSADPSSVGQGRSGGLPSRQPEANSLRRAAEPGQYVWRAGGHVNSQHQRPSFSNASVSMTSENAAISAPFTNGGLHANLEDAFDRGVTLEDTNGSLYSGGHRGSVERSSPAGINPYSFGTSRDDLTQGARSPLLEEFRSLHRTNRRYDLKDIYGHIVEFCGDQHGSRFIQDRLKVANSEEKERVFQEIMQNAVQLMKDLFGNYVIQRFFEHGDQVQKKLLAGAMIGRVGELSMQMYSCRVVQKALEHVLDDQQREIVDELRSDIVQVAKNPNGNHVVQKAVQMFPRQCIPFIMNAFQGQIEHLAVHQYACRIIQRILEHGTDDEKKRLLVDIHACAAKLMTDQYGNYVIQHIIEYGKPEDRSIMIHHVIDRTLALSRHKYASNVVEKCIVRGTMDKRRAIRYKLTTPNNDGMSPLHVMIRDQYGNYVVQKLLSYLDGLEKTEFALELSTYVPQMKKQGNSRQNSALDRLIAAIDAILEPLASTTNTNGGVTTNISAPSTPNLAVEVNSAVPTPLLTTEQNTPQSSLPP
ncbi:hypothetical protein CIB48_g10711 [Xylaria polymorpha]|nr:hypothetical protein CIB48_g10711 [Xylaria polymorpha]